MKIRIDQEECIECGLCASTCSDVFMLQTNEKASIVKCYQTGDPSNGEVGEVLRSCVEEAAESCLVQVIDTGSRFSVE
jgi:ferredoxin